MTTFYALKRKTTGTMEPTLYKRSEAARAKADQNGLYDVVPLYDTTPARAEAQDEGAAGERLAAKPLDWRKPTKRDRDEGGRDSALWIAPGFGGEYAIQSDLHNFILWRIDDPYAFDTFPTVDAAKAYAEADWQKTIGRKLTAHPSPTPAADADRVRIAVEALERIKAYRVCKESANIWTGANACQAIADETLAALKSTAAKEGEKS